MFLTSVELGEMNLRMKKLNVVLFSVELIDKYLHFTV